MAVSSGDACSAARRQLQSQVVIGMRKLLAVGFVTALIGIARAGLIDVGDRAPDFSLTLADGTASKLSTLLKEGPVLVRFAATG